MDGRMFLDGARVWARAGATTDGIDPATAEAFARVALGDTADVDAAVASARVAAGGWAGLAPVRRVRLLNRLPGVVPRPKPGVGGVGGPHVGQTFVPGGDEGAGVAAATSYSFPA